MAVVTARHQGVRKHGPVLCRVADRATNHVREESERLYELIGLWPVERSSALSCVRSNTAVQLVTGRMRPAVAARWASARIWASWGLSVKVTWAKDAVSSAGGSAVLSAWASFCWKAAWAGTGLAASSLSACSWPLTRLATAVR
jgi:hypothetical protein